MKPNRTPRNILDDASLTTVEKLSFLESMKAEAIHMQESDAEGFAGGERSHLDDIKRIIDKVKQEANGVGPP